jgi:uncharacterized membrane protein
MMMATDDDAPSEVAGGGDGGGNKLASALTSKELLVPAALSAAGALAASKGPDLIKKLSGEGEDGAEKLGARAAQGAKQSLSNGGGIAGTAVKKALSKAGGGSRKKTRRLPIQRWTDVAVPVDRAYEAWTKFDEFPKFMHRVLNVEQKGDDRVSWQEKIWFSTRDWEGRITEQRKNELIAWKTTKGMQHKGVVSFHPLGDRLTRVMVTMEFEPSGMIEKMGSGMRFVKRAVQADLARFKAYVEFSDAKEIDYEPNADAEEPASRERDARERADADGEREEREKRRQERRERTRTS